MNLTILAAVIICLMSMMTTTGFPPTTTTDANEVETTPWSTEEEAAATATEAAAAAVNDPVHAEPVKDVIALDALSAFFPSCVQVGCPSSGLVCDLHTKTCRQRLLDNI